MGPLTPIAGNFRGWSSSSSSASAIAFLFSDIIGCAGIVGEELRRRGSRDAMVVVGNKLEQTHTGWERHAPHVMAFISAEHHAAMLVSPAAETDHVVVLVQGAFISP